MENNKDFIITPDVITKVLELMAKGLTEAQVAAHFRISKSKLISALNKSEDLKEQFDCGRTFFEARCEELYYEVMSGEKSGRDTLILRWMERNFPEWSKKEHVTVSSDPIKELDDEKLEERIKALKLQVNDDNS
jgi:hypothetical protein